MLRQFLEIYWNDCRRRKGETSLTPPPPGTGVMPPAPIDKKKRAKSAPAALPQTRRSRSTSAAHEDGSSRQAVEIDAEAEALGTSSSPPAEVRPRAC